MYVDIEDMLGKIFVSVEKIDDDELVFKTETEIYTFQHDQECCENVEIESIVGDLQDLVGEPLVRAEENSKEDPEACESGTWTFYKFATRKGYVDVRWYGSSNGYYSESVSLKKEMLN